MFVRPGPSRAAPHSLSRERGRHRFKGERGRTSEAPITFKLEFHPATAERWPDLERLFGRRGACAGCWCQYWRRAHAEYEAGKGAGNRRALKRIVGSGEVPGILAYADGEPIGWCAVAPRERFPRLARSRILKPVDERPVWSIVCLFIARPYRRRGVSVALLRAAAKHAAAQGAEVVEGYPVEPREDRTPDAFAWTGIASAYERAGFREVARRSETRPIVRWTAPRRRARRAEPR